ncbi:hypothetical protein Tco_0079615, partial [Tanacetum coccineum]
TGGDGKRRGRKVLSFLYRFVLPELGGLGREVEDLLSLESLILESSILMKTGSGKFHVGWEYPAKN